MAKNTKNNSKRIKTSHKKALVKRKVAHTHVDRPLANVNKFIGDSVAKQQADPKIQKIEAESMTFDELRKLIDGPSQNKKPAKLSVADISYLEALLKKWGNNYQRMSKDVKLNRMQWTAHQIEKKHQAFNQL